MKFLASRVPDCLILSARLLFRYPRSLYARVMTISVSSWRFLQSLAPVVFVICIIAHRTIELLRQFVNLPFLPLDARCRTHKMAFSSTILQRQGFISVLHSFGLLSNCLCRCRMDWTPFAWPWLKNSRREEWKDGQIERWPAFRQQFEAWRHQLRRVFRSPHCFVMHELEEVKKGLNCSPDTEDPSFLF